MEYKKMVSVAIITYQHINYIEQTIKSVLMQETSYDYEIVIADDCSTDGTREIVQKYKEMFAEPEDISPEEVEASIRFSFSPW